MENTIQFANENDKTCVKLDFIIERKVACYDFDLINQINRCELEVCLAY